MRLAAQALLAHRFQPFGKIGKGCRDGAIGPVKILAGKRQLANGGADIGTCVAADRIRVMLCCLLNGGVEKLDEAADHGLGQRVFGFEMIEQAAFAHARFPRDFFPG